MKKSDFAIREEKERMLGAVVDIQRRFRQIDELQFNLDKDIRAIEEAISRYGRELRKPLLRFFTGDILELTTLEAHEQFLRSVKELVRAGRLRSPQINAPQLLESLKTQLTRNIDTLIAGADAGLKARAQAIKSAAAESVNAAATAQLSGIQLKIESITERTTGATGDAIGQAWEDLKAKYGTRETVKYRNGANYPLNTYLDGRANTTSADIHRVTTQLDASVSGVFTGMVSRHGATDSCRQWEGKILFFTVAGRDIMSKKFPAMADWPTVDEVKDDEDTHLWKFNCRHIITPYPIQFFDDEENHKLIKKQAA